MRPVRPAAPVRPRSVLRANLAYRRLWLAQAGSWFGDYFNSVALAAATLDLTHSAGAMAGVLLCRGIPVLALGPLFGPAIDRWPKRRVMWMADALRALVALAFIVAFGRREIALVDALAVLLGVGSALFQPAQSAAMREIVAPDELVAANATLTLASGAVAVVGAALGGLATSWLGPDLAFATNALSYVWSAARIAGARWPAPEPAAPRHGYLAQLRSGARAVTGDRVALAATLASVGFALTSGPYFVAPPVLADLVYRMGSLGIGLVYAADGMGFIASALLIQRVIGHEPRRLRRLYGASYLVQAAFLTLFCLSTRLWQGMAAIFISQVASGAILTLTRSFLQARTPPSAQGRVFAFQSALGGGMAQVSIAVAGAVMVAHGVAAVGPPVAAVCVLGAVVWFALTSDAHMRERPSPAG